VKAHWRRGRRCLRIQRAIRMYVTIVSVDAVDAGVGNCDFHPRSPYKETRLQHSAHVLHYFPTCKIPARLRIRPCRGHTDAGAYGRDSRLASTLASPARARRWAMRAAAWKFQHRGAIRRNQMNALSRAISSSAADNARVQALDPDDEDCAAAGAGLDRPFSRSRQLHGWCRKGGDWIVTSERAAGEAGTSTR